MYFNRFDIVEAYYLFFEQNYSGMFHPNYIRRCKMETYFKPAIFYSYETLSENGKYIFDSLVERNYESK
jgi:hypothetical protein